MPTVSAIIVFHRLNEFLPEAVRSILTQTLSDLELILVDNGAGVSSDALGDGGRDPRVRWVRLPSNLGIPGGHNAGIAAARSEFVALLDYDDVALPARLEKQVAALRADASLGLVACCAERIDAAGYHLGREFALCGTYAQKEYTRYASPVVTPAYAGRRDVFAALPYRTEFPLAADFDFIARVAERWTLGGVPEVLLRYRWHAGQTTQLKAAEMERGFCAIRLLTARRRGGRPEDFDSLRNGLVGEPPVPAESCRRAAKLCIEEGWGALAAYHARRLFVLDRTPQRFFQASGLALRAWRVARASERMLAARLFFMGPVRAHRLRPQ